VDALRVLRTKRPAAAYVFATKYGNRWTGNAVAHEFAKTAVRAGLELPDGVGLGAARHTFITYANEVRDLDARRHIAGRMLQHLEDVYVETLFVQRLAAVTNHVRGRLEIGAVVGRHP
jgi:hypothetical protein